MIFYFIWNGKHVDWLHYYCETVQSSTLAQLGKVINPARCLLNMENAYHPALLAPKSLASRRGLGRLICEPLFATSFATLLLQHSRRHQNHSTRNPFWKSTLLVVFGFGPVWLLLSTCLFGIWCTSLVVPLLHFLSPQINRVFHWVMRMRGTDHIRECSFMVAVDARLEG